MDTKSRIIRVVKLSALLLIPILLYNVGTTALLTNSTEHPDVPTQCQSSGVKSSLQFGSSIDVNVESDTTTILPDRNSSVKLSFTSADVNIARMKGFKSTPGGYVSEEGRFSVLSYKIEDSQNSAFDRLPIQNGSYTILPDISGDEGYNISPEQNLYGHLVYIENSYTTENTDVGCQNFDYFSPREYDIRTHEKMLERTSGRIPFHKNYSNIEIVFVDDNLTLNSVDARAISVKNIIFIEKGKNSRTLFLHEYIHTRQEYFSFKSNMRESWFTEGTAQYHSLEALRESGYMNRYEYNYMVSKWLRQADSLNTSKAYRDTGISTNHYAFGPIIFHSYERDTGEVDNYTKRESSLPEYYKNYKIEGGLCSNIPCKILSAGLGILYDFHRIPTVYAGLPAYLIFLEIVGMIKIRVSSDKKNQNNE